MSVFGRRRGQPDPDEVELDPEETVTGLEEDLEPAASVGAPATPLGPWDADSLPAGDERERLDFGGLRLWIPEGVDLRVDFGEQGDIVALTLAVPADGGDHDAMQLSAFAAPRTAGIWADVRVDIAEGITSSGGRAEAVDGPWGPELRARLATDQPGVLAPARFLGIDGPRWFVRALLTGPSAAVGVDPPALDAALRALVVVRGKDAMAPRDPLPLVPPPELAEQMAAAMAQGQGQGQPT